MKGVGNVKVYGKTDERKSRDRDKRRSAQEEAIEEEVVGGTPASCGYDWDEARQLWHRPWDPDAPTISGEAKHWFNDHKPEKETS